MSLAGERYWRHESRVPFCSRSIGGIGETPALAHFADSNRTPPEFRDATKPDNRLIMTAEPGSQTETEPRVAGTRWPTDVRHGIRRLNGRLSVPFPCHWVLSCRMVQRDVRRSPDSAQGQYPEPQHTDRSIRSDGW